MRITVGIEGMACSMCEAYINKVVRSALWVKKVTSLHTKKQTVILAEQEIPKQKLKNVIAEAGYDVVSVNRVFYKKKRVFSASRGWHYADGMAQDVAL